MTSSRPEWPGPVRSRFDEACAIRRLAFAALLSLSFSSASCHAATEHWGWIEQSWLMPERMQAKAKLDTGALTSSLDARNIHRYKKDGERWVRFDVVLPTADSKAPVSVTFERKVLRLIKVRGAGGSDSRPVVAMDICLGAKLLREQFSLRDRGNMNYPVLLGRRARTPRRGRRVPNLHPQTHLRRARRSVRTRAAVRRPAPAGQHDQRRHPQVARARLVLASPARGPGPFPDRPGAGWCGRPRCRAGRRSLRPASTSGRR